MNKVVRLRDLTPDEANDPWLVRGANGENIDLLDTPTFTSAEDDDDGSGCILQDRRAGAAPCEEDELLQKRAL